MSWSTTSVVMSMLLIANQVASASESEAEQESPTNQTSASVETKQPFVSLEPLPTKVATIDLGQVVLHHPRFPKQIVIEINRNFFTSNKRLKPEDSQQLYMVYLDTVDHIKTYATEHGIALVIRVNRSTLKHDDPVEIIREMNKSTVYDHNFDITDEIIKLVNRDETSSATPEGADR